MTRAAFIEQTIDGILSREGWPAYSNRAADRGGPTKGGITIKKLSEWVGRVVAIAELQALDEATARDIYRHEYLHPWSFVDNDRLFQVLVDYAVTSWHDDPTLAVQQALGLDQDGILGPKTREAIRVADAAALRLQVIGYRVRHMVDLALEDPALKRLIRGHDDLQLLNLRGWISRATAAL